MSAHSARDQLTLFGAMMAREHFEHGEIEGLRIEKLAIRAGILLDVTATEPCGTNCVCAKVKGRAAFPVACFTVADDMRVLVAQLTAPVESQKPQGWWSPRS